MQLYVQKLTSTTFPCKDRELNGGELSQDTAPSRLGIDPQLESSGCESAALTMAAFQFAKSTAATAQIAIAAIDMMRVRFMRRLSQAFNIDDGLREGLRSFLRQVVADAAGDKAVLILARELSAIRRAGRVDCTVGVAFHGDRGHSDGRKCGQPFFQVVIFPLTVGQAKPPAIVVHHYVNVVGVVEGRCCAVV